MNAGRREPLNRASYPREDVLYETILAKFGSRFLFGPTPNKRRVYHGLLGTFFAYPQQLTLAVKWGSTVRFLPFSTRHRIHPLHRKNDVFETVQQEIGMTYIAYHCSSEDIPIGVVFRIEAPFYPGDEKLSTAPFFYISALVENRADQLMQGQVVVSIDTPALPPLPESDIDRSSYDMKDRPLVRQPGVSPSAVSVDGLTGLSFKRENGEGGEEILIAQPSGVTVSLGDEPARGREVGGDSPEGQLGFAVAEAGSGPRDAGLAWQVRLAAGESASKDFILAGYYADPILKVNGELKRFRYTTIFASALEVARFAETEKGEIRRKTDIFESTVRDCSLPDAAKKLLAFGFHGYTANTWWTDGDPGWFTVWEGDCWYHSTIDVAYDCEMFTLLYWPDLLRRQIEEWAQFPRAGGYPPHDLGRGFLVHGQDYGHDMPAEETLDFILLLYACWKLYSDAQLASEHYPEIVKLLRFLRSTDGDGDGIPDTPETVLNTFDEASHAIQGSKAQSYMAVKTLAAFVAGEELASEQGDAVFARECQEMVRKIAGSVRERLWRGDHFAICADPEIRYRDQFTMHAANGLLYLLLAGARIPLPMGWFRKDIERHTRTLMRWYGCAHSSADGNGWVSKNVCRDAIGRFLGLDTLSNCGHYWEFERSLNAKIILFNSYNLSQDKDGIAGKMPKGIWEPEGYTDIFCYGRELATIQRYPRGTAAFCLLPALGRIALDQVKGRLWIAPPAESVHAPILPLADWQSGSIPWLHFDFGPSKVALRIRDAKSLAGLKEIQLEIPSSFKPTRLRFGQGGRGAPLARLPRKIEVAGAAIEIRSCEERGGAWTTSIAVRPRGLAAGSRAGPSAPSSARSSASPASGAGFPSINITLLKG